MRRSGMNRAERSGDIIERGALKLDILSSQAFLRGEDLYLTPKQFALLLLLVRGEGKILSNEYLYETVWKQPLTDDCGALWKQMSRLRAKSSKNADSRSSLSARTTRNPTLREKAPASCGNLIRVS